ncbi:MAG: zf-TFIIB domain-containing protein [Planctomycetales bacterium]|nr:zf-TFIIB domain-containing protein [Planctomycetales bacterium]
MAAFNYAHDSGVFISKCDSCGGVWLETGQLELIAQYRSGSPAIQRLGNAMADEMLAANKLQFARRLLRSRLLSGIVAIGYLLFIVLATGSLQSVLSLLLGLMLPMVCIWFPDAMGNLKGISLGFARPMITETTPGDFVAIGGWLLLLCPAAMALMVRT